ncbi:MAG: Spx/MgsR family RNA polymerase-binding regulatory protein [Bacilli bacterium]|nr:Spx/MgsR family RNA polymerase-binding regulatory protein [Bacilli bacterium]
MKNLLLGYKKCSTSNKLVKLLKENRIDVKRIDIFEEKISHDLMLDIINLSSKSIDHFFNKNGKYFKKNYSIEHINKLNFQDKLDLLLHNGYMIKRPILVLDNQVFIGFDERAINNYILDCNK